MDSRAKQRLTGAIILVALFVLLVPELLTGPRSQAPTTEAPADEGLRRYTIDLDAPNSSAQSAPASGNPPAVTLPPVAENPPRADARALPGEAAAPAPGPVSPPAQTPAAPMAATPKPVTPTVAAAPTPAPRTEVPHPTNVTAPAASGSFAVQLGSFNKRDNADRLVREMIAKGFNAFVAPITSGGRELYRVRVGPARDRAAAEALAAQLRRMGQTGSIVSIS